MELQENGEGMINESHYASDLIRVRYKKMTTPSRRNQIYHIYGSITEYHTELCEPTHPIGAPGLSSQTMGVVAFQVCREGSDASLYPEESALSARNRRSYVLDSREGKLHVL